jgi:hypothetical protein
MNGIRAQGGGGGELTQKCPIQAWRITQLREVGLQNSLNNPARLFEAIQLELSSSPTFIDYGPESQDTMRDMDVAHIPCLRMLHGMALYSDPTSRTARSEQLERYRPLP